MDKTGSGPEGHEWPEMGDYFFKHRNPQKK
jgi:hypothetical protein